MAFLRDWVDGIWQRQRCADGVKGCRFSLGEHRNQRLCALCHAAKPHNHQKRPNCLCVLFIPFICFNALHKETFHEINWSGFSYSESHICGTHTQMDAWSDEIAETVILRKLSRHMESRNEYRSRMRVARCRAQSWLPLERNWLIFWTICLAEPLSRTLFTLIKRIRFPWMAYLLSRHLLNTKSE